LGSEDPVQMGDDPTGPELQTVD